MAISRDDVVDTAVRLLGEVGLEGLTLRRVARELGVSAPTLYWHVADKRALLDHVAERLLADQWRASPPEADQPWWAWLHERALGQYRVLAAHRDAAHVVAGNRPTDATLPAVETALGVLADAGFAPLEAHRALMSLGSLVIGAAVEHHAEQADRREQPPPEVGGYPRLAGVLAAMRAGGGDHETEFAHGLDLLIDGLRARVDDGRGSGQPPGSDRSPTEVAATSATWSR